MQYELFSQDLSSSKTSRGLLVQNSKGTGGKIQPEPLFCSMSSVNWKEWVTSVRGAYSVRLKSAHLTREKESLSLQGELKGRPSLPTTAVVECRVEKSENGHNLNWPTPAARDVKGLSGKGRQERKGHPTDTLPNAVAVWPTPTAAEGSKIGSQANYGQVGLSNHPAIVGHPDREKLNKSGKSQELWATPTASAAEKPQGPNSKQQGLQSQAKDWATPTQDGNHNRKGASKHSGDGIATQVQNWPTPRETMSRDVDHDRGKGNLGEKVQSKGMKLNPSWVEQLMGLPVNWTQLPTGWIVSDCSATVLSPILVK